MLKRLLLLLPLITVLAACQSKKDVCALWNSGVISNYEAGQKLGLAVEGEILTAEDINKEWRVAGLGEANMTKEQLANLKSEQIFFFTDMVNMGKSIRNKQKISGFCEFYMN